MALYFSLRRNASGPWRRAQQPTPLFLPGEFHGQKSGRVQYMESAKSGTQQSDLAWTHARIIQLTVTRASLVDQTVTDLPALQETWVRTLGQEESPGEGKQLPIPRWPGGRNGKPVQYSCLQSLVNRGAWRATLHGVTESDTTQQLTYTMPLKSWSAGKVRRKELSGGRNLGQKAVIVPSLSCVQLFVTLWTPTCQASLSFTILQFAQTHVHRIGNAIQPISFSATPFSSCPPSFPASGSFPVSQLFTSEGWSNSEEDEWFWSDQGRSTYSLLLGDPLRR